MSEADWCYVFGVVPSSSRLPPTEETGLATGLRLVEAHGVAAVVGQPPTDRPLGLAGDLRDHDRILGEILRAGVPVLPMRFGAVLANEQAVREELLAVNGEEFRAALAIVTGHVQYTVKVGYEEDTVLRDVVATNPRIAALRDRGAASFDDRLRLGELVVSELERRRPAVAQEVLEHLGPTTQQRTRPSTVPDQVLDLAVLVADSDAPNFERRVDELAESYAGRLRFRLVGPVPAYDFVGNV